MNLKDVKYEDGLRVCLSGIERNGHADRHTTNKGSIGTTKGSFAKDIVIVVWDNRPGVNVDYYIEELQIYSETITVKSILDDLDALAFNLL